MREKSESVASTVPQSVLLARYKENCDQARHHETLRVKKLGSGMTIDLRWSKAGGSETVCTRDAHLAGSLLGLENRKKWGHCVTLNRIIGASWSTGGRRVRTYTLRACAAETSRARHTT